MAGLRRQARTLALQLLYQYELHTDPSAEALEGFWRGAGASRRARAFATELVEQTQANRDAIDALIARNMEQWRLERVAVIVRNLLRMAVCEMLFLRETPHAVVIDEAVSLTGEFADDDSARFVNSVLQRCWDASGSPAPAANSGP